MAHFLKKDIDNRGFTIVELLIVIVIIGILAAISIVAFNGVQQRAVTAALQTDLLNASKQFKVAQVTDSAYPADTASLKGSNGTTFQYSVNNAANPQTFCLTATNGTTSYYIDQNTGPQTGTCTGHAAGGAAVMTWSQVNLPVTASWSVLLMSADGMKMVVSSNSGAVYKTSNGGTSWTSVAKPDSSRDVRQPGLLTPDGGRLLLSGYGDGSSVSFMSPDFGATWSLPVALGWDVTRFAVSSNGMKLYAVQSYDSDAGGGSIYKSVNGGANWLEVRSGSINWSAIAMSSDGARVVAVSYDSLFPQQSTDEGVSWTSLAGAGSRVWSDIAMSSDGTKLAAIGGNALYTSSDSGVTWTLRTGLGNPTSVAMSADGTRLIAAEQAVNKFVYTSKDAGVTWTQETELGSGYWIEPVISADGTRYGLLKSAGATYTLHSGVYQ